MRKIEGDEERGVSEKHMGGLAAAIERVVVAFISSILEHVLGLRLVLLLLNGPIFISLSPAP